MVPVAVGQLGAVGIRPYYQGLSAGFNRKRFLFGLKSTEPQSHTHTWMKIETQRQSCRKCRYGVGGSGVSGGCGDGVGGGIH